MPHADEGQIHAYLDRQGEFADPVKRRDLGNHIADCASCTRVLKEARRLRSDAEELLRATRVREVQAPPFAEVAARAESRMQSGVAPTDAGATSPATMSPPASQKRFRVWRSLVWAATIVLAVGIGWSVRPLLMTPSPSAAPVMGFADGRASDAPAGAAHDTASLELADESAVRRREVDAVAQEDVLAKVTEERAAADALGLVADSQEVSRLAAALDPRIQAQGLARGDSAAAVPPVRQQARALSEVVTTGVAGADSMVADSVLNDSMVAESVLAERELTRARDAGLARANVAPAAEPAPIPLSFDSDRSRLPGDWNIISREEAEAILGGPLVWVPSLDIVGLGRTETPNGVRLLQSAGSGALLELEIRAIVPASAGNREATRPVRIRVMTAEVTNASTGTATVGRYLITAKAGFPEASLRRLLEQVTYAPTADQLRNY